MENLIRRTNSPLVERHQGKWRLVLFGTLIICIYGGLRSEPLPLLFPYFDLLIHFSASLTIAYIAVFAFPPRGRLLVMVGLFSAAVALEVMQGVFLARRAASLADCLAGILGIPFGWFLGRWVRQYLRRWSKNSHSSRLRKHW
ncbi:hypothetical protein [uncultured Microbulbifer sp.]|uniref:hypothetical protein n=1 Tax=uncultured Microbulbifer sp. TaxID=348147 RepID=UPI0025DCDE2F|nr:hypothetical protein [uncultured Microbulbifer sp.]